MVGGIFYEHGHRMIATAVGFLTVVLVLLLMRKEERSWMRKLAGIALLAVILQGVLGGMTVLFLLPTWISVSHASLAQSFFCLVCSIALFESSWWQHSKRSTTGMKHGRSMYRFGSAVVGAVFIQLVLGAIMRHSGAGLAVPDIPLAYGKVFPSLTEVSVGQYNAELILRDIRLAADGPITREQIAIHLLHRYWAVIAGVLVMIFAARLYKNSGPVKNLRYPAIALGVLIPVQVLLGAYTVLSRKQFEITTMHVATGALILATTLLGTLMAYRTTDPSVVEHSPFSDLGEVTA